MSSLPETTALVTASSAVWLNKVVSWDGKSINIEEALTRAFEAEDYLTCIKNLREKGIDPQSYINSLDKVIDSLTVDSTIQRRCIRALRKTCGIYGILPTSYTITFALGELGPRPYTSGGFSDVWKLTDPQNVRGVFAVKQLRVYEKDPRTMFNKRFCKEVVVCKRAKHPNILSIEGVAPSLFTLCMVTPWMENGDILNFVTKHPEADRLDLLIGVTCGLEYLHYNDVVHGDLKSANILIDDNGTPRLSDFGLCSITKNINSVNASTPNHGCTLRYRAPELLDNDEVVGTNKRKSTNESDVYSLSMVIVGMATGKIPFPEFTDFRVATMVLEGERPEKPQQFDAMGITPSVWEVAKKCWHGRAKERPEVRKVLQSFQEMAELRM